MKLRIALCGFGYFGANYARILSKHEQAELVVICDLNLDNLKKARAQYPNIPTSINTDDLLRHYDFDCAIVATPVTTHSIIVNKMLLSGKHVLCEKAFTTDSEKARALIQDTKLHNVKLAIGHTYIHNPCVQTIKKLLEEKALGDVYYVAMTRVGNSPLRGDCSTFFDLGAHDISMLIHWFGMPVEVSSFGESYLQDGLEDFVVTNLKFKNRVIANIKNSWINPVKRRYVTIVGSEKMLVFDDIDKLITIYDKEGNIKEEEQHKESEPLKEQVNDFIDSVLSDRQPLVTGEDGLAVVKILESAQQSLKNNSEKVYL